MAPRTSDRLNPSKSRAEGRARLVVVALFLFTLFSLLITVFYKIQILEGDKWKMLAKAQHQMVVKEPSRRGVFYSNGGVKYGHPEKAEPFVVDVTVYHLYADPLRIPKQYREEVGTFLLSEVRLDKDVFRELAEPSRSRRLASGLAIEEKQLVTDWWERFAKERKIAKNALYFMKDYKRSYPFGRMLGQVLHTVRDEKDVKTRQAIPTGGLEQHFDRYLRGRDGEKLSWRSPKYELEGDEVKVPPEDGKDIYLTINHCLQAIAEEELAAGVLKAKAKGGFVVMMEPFTGEILALAHYPFFEPGRYADYYNDPKLLEHTQMKAVSYGFEPGSTMKAITIAIALKANEELKARGKPPLFSPHDKMCTDKNIFPGRTQPLKDVSLHHYLNMYLAIQKSSNIYPARLAQKIVETLGADWYRNQLIEVFGFGRKTGIEVPSESYGLVPTPGKTYPNGVLEWSAPTPYSLAIGYNILVNAIQMVRAYAVFANGGFEVKPTLIRKIVGRDGVILDNTGFKEKKRVLSEEIVEEIITAMKYTTKPGGSAVAAEIPGFTEVGKTGTAEKLIKGAYCKNAHFTNFIGFAPLSHPAFVLIVAIDEPEPKFIPGVGRMHFGGKCSAPVFREIAKRALQYLGTPPDDPFGYPKGDPRFDPEKADWIKETKQITELYNKWNK